MLLMRFTFILIPLALLLCRPICLQAQSALQTGNNEQQLLFHQLLQRLSQGDLKALKAAGLDTLLAPLGRLDPKDTNIIRQRQSDLRAVIAQLQAPKAQEALQILDAKCKELLLLKHDLQQVSLLLPSPLAQSHMSAAADRYFDHGKFHQFLRIQQILGVTNDPRLAVAQALIGNELKLYDLGLCLPDTAPLIDMHAGQSVAWHIHNAYVHACDPWHGVLWQRALGRYAEIQTGPKHILLKDQRGFHIINEHGYSAQLPPIAHAQSISVSAYHAWFGIEQNVYSYDLNNKTVRSWALSEKPLCAPIDTQDASLWLGEHYLHFIDGKNIHRFRHGFQADQTWHLSHNGQHAFITNAQGHQFKIHKHQDSLQHNKTLTLIRSELWDLAWNTCNEKSTYVQEWITAPNSFLNKHKTALHAMLSQSPMLNLKLQLRLANWQAHGDNTDMLALLNKVSADALLPLGDHDYLRSTYEHAISVRGLQAWNQQKDRGIPKHIKVHAAKALTQASGENIKLVNLKRRYAAQLSEDGNILVTSHDNENRLLWRHYFEKRGYHPSLSFSHTAQHVIVSVGTKQCIILNAQSGHILACSHIPGQFNDPKYIALFDNKHICSHGPTAIHNQILLHKNIGQQSHNQIVKTAQAVRWILPINDTLIYSDGEKAYRYSDGAEINLAQAIVQSQSVTASHDGIIADGRLYRWL